MHSVKLTLRLDKKLIDFAKRYAAQNGKSVSQMVAEYFNLLEETVPQAKQPIVNGGANPPKNGEEFMCY